MNHELSDRARALLESAKHQGGPTTAQKAKLTVAVMTATAGTAAAMTTGVAATGLSAAKLVGAGVLALFVGVAGTAMVTTALRSPPPARAITTVSPTTVPTRTMKLTTEEPAAPPRAIVAPPIEPGRPAPEPVAAKAEPSRPSAPPRAVAPPTATPDLSTPDVEVVRPAPSPTIAAVDSSTEEVTALGAALEALEENRPLEALNTARAARLSWPRGILRPEFTVIEISALCALGRASDAREVSGSLPSADRTPLVLEKLRRSCVGGQP